MWRSSLTSRWTSPPSPPPPSSTLPVSPPSTSPTATPFDQGVQKSFRRRPTLLSNPDTIARSFQDGPSRSPSQSPLAKSRPLSPSEDDPATLLNRDLKIFAGVYLDVKIEVLRELLLRFDGDSRLQISMEQLIKYKSQWTRGRLLNPPRNSDDQIPTDELFRSKTYVEGCKRTLLTEFKSLNKSVVDGVLAEVNQSYSKARPVLQEIAAKSWRATFSTLFRKKKSYDEVPTFLIQRGAPEPRLQPTGDVELDEELEQFFCAGPRRQRQQLQTQIDADLANAVNEKEAATAQAMFECQVCYNDVPFESIVTCTAEAHVICHSCVRLSLKEATFGQGWAQSVDIPHGTLRCLASDTEGSCSGYISPGLLHLTIVSGEAGPESWTKFEQRLAADNVLKSGLALVRCPFCDYAETPYTYSASSVRSIKWRFRTQQVSSSFILGVILAEFILPIVLLVIVVTSLAFPGRIRHLFNTSLVHLHRLAQSKRFRCKHPACRRTSCLSCSKPWHDPHTCHEPLIISLRTAVEAARTAALKRTCPRCGMSFIKSSGCNKLTCVCGYAMCYICRKNIGKVDGGTGAVDDREGGEGYRHFCEHFRPTAGQKCTECRKCDLYMNENEEMLVQKAGQEAEREWREREGMVGVKGLGLEQAVGNLGRLEGEGVHTQAWSKLVRGDWTVQEVCDWIVSNTIVVES